MNKIDKEVFDDVKNDELIEVLVYLNEQVDSYKIANAKKASLQSISTPNNIKLEVRKTVIESLREKSEISQQSILKYLENERDKGRVEDFKSYHIVNMLYVKASRDVIEQMAYMTEIGKIYKNKTYTREKPTINKDIKTEAVEGLEWNIERVRANEVWDMGYDGTGIVVGLIDSGATWDHPALKHKWRGYNPVTEEVNSNKNWFDPVYNNPLPNDDHEVPHGTHVLGTILGQEEDGSNKIGVAPGAKWIAARVFNDWGSTTDEILLSAAEWMLAPGGDPSAAPDIVNNSWGGGDGIDDWYREAIRNWRAAGIFPAFAAGNQRPGEPAPWPGSISIPSNYPESFAVGATDIRDVRGSFSKLGPSPYDPKLIKPNIVAPGVNIRSSVPYGDGYESGWDGTSMATPAVSGVVALMMSANNSMAVDDLEFILESSAKPLTDKTYPEAPNFGYGYGLVDAYEAVNMISAGTGIIEGSVYTPGMDSEDPVIIHEQKNTEAYLGSDIEILAQLSDDISITKAEILVKEEKSPYWKVIPMKLIAGDHKSGTYKGIITQNMLSEGPMVYKIKINDFAGNAVVTEDYKVNVLFGVDPFEYSQNFEDDINGWQLSGMWEWGKPSGSSPKAYEGEKLVATILDGEYPPTEMESWMIAPPIDLRNVDSEIITFRFHEWYDIEVWDEGHVLISNDFGETWEEARRTIKGSNKNWREAAINLSDYINSEEPVFVAFNFKSYLRFEERTGWYIDNVRLVGIENDPPEAPRGLESELDMKSIKVKWEDSISGDTDYYNVYRSETSGKDHVKIGQTSDNSYVDTNIANGKIYYYLVQAVDYNGNIGGYSEELKVKPLVTTVVFGTDFEEDNGGFITGGTKNSWEHGIPTSGPNKAFSGEKLWATNLDGDYLLGSDSYIETPEIEIPNSMDVVLEFAHWIDMKEDGDDPYGKSRDATGMLQISNDGGGYWDNITPDQYYRNYGGHKREWENESVSLNYYKGQTVKFRFKFWSSGWSTSYPGWYIDDVYVIASDLPEPDNFKQALEVKKDTKTDQPRREFKYKLNKETSKKYESLEDSFVQRIPLAKSGIPVSDAVITVLETGRSVKVNPATGKYRMRVELNEEGQEWTLRTEAYGHYPKETKVSARQSNTVVRHDIMMDPIAQGSISGRVVDRYYGNPAPFAQVRLVEDPMVAPVRADENGYFVMPKVYIGDYTLKVKADGFYSDDFSVTVKGNENTEVELGLKRYVGYQDEIGYDDGVGEQGLALNQEGHGFGVKFTPEEYARVKGANVYFWDKSFPEPGSDRIGIAIYDIDSKGQAVVVGEPTFLDIERGAWNYIDLSSYRFFTGDDFFIGTIQQYNGSYSPALGIDVHSPHNDRSFFNINGEFIPVSSENIPGAVMIRAVMEQGVDVPEITNYEELNYITERAVTIEGNVDSNSKVNLYLNGKKFLNTHTEDYEFAINLNLIEEKNVITMTAEFEGVETEHSKPITIIVDQDAPVLEVTKPSNDDKFNVEVIHVEGQVREKYLDKLSINGEEVEVDEAGNFKERLFLEEGQQTIVIKAVDLAGNETVVEREIAISLKENNISNIKPAQDIDLRQGETLRVSFNAPSGGQGYFRIALAKANGLQGNSLGIPMTEKDGLYSGSWTVPKGYAATDLNIELIYVDEFGIKVMELAAGKLTIIGEMEDLASNTIIIGEEAFDSKYIDRNVEIQEKLAEWISLGYEVYIKLNEHTLVNSEGELVSIDELPYDVTYFDATGNVIYYKK